MHFVWVSRVDRSALLDPERNRFYETDHELLRLETSGQIHRIERLLDLPDLIPG